RSRFDAPPPNPAQLSLFPGLPPSTRVQPAIRLTEANVARSVPPGRPGVFFLKSVGSDGQVSERVGRDDVDLRQRLLRYPREGKATFVSGWTPAGDAKEASQLGCSLWHAHGGAWARIEGDAHPTPAERIPFLGCPDCDE